MEETYTQGGYTCYVGGTWCEITKDGQIRYAGNVPEGTTARRALEMWLFQKSNRRV